MIKKPWSASSVWKGYQILFKEMVAKRACESTLSHSTSILVPLYSWYSMCVSSKQRVFLIKSCFSKTTNVGVTHHISLDSMERSI